MKRVLLVVRPFASYAIGDLIREAGDIRQILVGAHAHDVIRVAAPTITGDKREEA